MKLASRTPLLNLLRSVIIVVPRSNPMKSAAKTMSIFFGLTGWVTSSAKSMMRTEPTSPADTSLSCWMLLSIVVYMCLLMSTSFVSFNTSCCVFGSFFVAAVLLASSRFRLFSCSSRVLIVGCSGWNKRIALCFFCCRSSSFCCKTLRFSNIIWVSAPMSTEPTLLR